MGAEQARIRSAKFVDTFCLGFDTFVTEVAKVNVEAESGSKIVDAFCLGFDNFVVAEVNVGIIEAVVGRGIVVKGDVLKVPKTFSYTLKPKPYFTVRACLEMGWHS